MGIHNITNSNLNTLEIKTNIDAREASRLSYNSTSNDAIDINGMSNDIEVNNTVDRVETTARQISTNHLEDSYQNDNFEFVIDPSDTIFVLTINHSKYKADIRNIVSKMIVLKEPCTVYLDRLSATLYSMGIDKLHIFSIRCNDYKTNKNAISQKGSNVVYLDLKETELLDFLKNGRESGANFLEYNAYSLYILRGGNYLDIKNIFASIEDKHVNLGRGGGQKSHILSPLDLRLTCYMLALFDYKTLKYLNTFDVLSKDRYLSYTDYTNKSKVKPENSILKYVTLKVDKMPLHNVNLGEHNFLNCLDDCKILSKEIFV